MSQITVSLETAKKMKKAGFNKESLLCWEYFEQAKKHSCVLSLTDFTEEPYLEARTAQEIIDELPNTIDGCVLTINKVNVEKEWEKMYYWAWYLNRLLKWIHNWKSVAHVWVNASEALAKLRLRCKENWYI